MANHLPDNAFTSRRALDPGLHRGVKFPRAAFTFAGNAAGSTASQLPPHRYR